MNTIPALPNKDKLLSLLSDGYVGIPNWSDEEQQEVYAALKSLSFHCYRTEKFLEINID